MFPTESNRVEPYAKSDSYRGKQSILLDDVIATLYMHEKSLDNVYFIE